MELLTKEIEEKMPDLREQDGKGDDAVVYVKFFHPMSDWRWYATEMRREDDDVVFFGLVSGFEVELGYFSLSELESVGKGGMLPIERDLYFGEATLGDVRKALEAGTPL